MVRTGYDVLARQTCSLRSRAAISRALKDCDQLLEFLRDCI